MKIRVAAAIIAVGLMTAPAMASAERLQTAIGGAVGGGLGALIGNELAGRGGAIVGGAVGAALASAITAPDNRRESRRDGPWRDFGYFDTADVDRWRWR